MMTARRRTSIVWAILAGTLTLIIGFGHSQAFAQPVTSPNSPSSTELVERPEEWNGEIIEFEGEVISERMVRGAYAWIHVNDDGYYLKNIEEGAGLRGYNSGMPVWIPAELTDDIDTYGDYKHEGEVVKVRGVFNAACAEHGGDMDIHASTLQRLIPGRVAVDEVNSWKIPVAVVMVLLAAILWWADRRSSATLKRGLVTGKRA